MEANKLGTKIVVLEVSASGKTTFARRLGEKTGLPVTYMDAVMWRPGWKYIGDEETTAHIHKVSLEDTWIIEGFIDKNAQQALFEKADSLLYLDYPGWLSVWRYIKRWFKHRKNSRPELPNSPEKFSLEFLKRVYTKKEVYRLEKLFRTVDFSSKITRFKSSKEAENFLHSI
jgi:adenylate kinase family enzyme